MVRRSLLAAFAFAVLLLASEALAQVSATVVLRSGERVNGQLVDMGASGLVMSAAGGERRLPLGEVAIIDFVGGGQGIPETELSAIQPGQHILLLRGGQSLRGSLYDISGTNPLQIAFRTDGGERRFTSNEIGRILIARPADQPAPTTGTAAPAPAPAPSTPAPNLVTQATIAVPGNAQWTNTGVSVRQGEDIYFSANGTIQMSDNGADTATPGGSASQRTAAGAPLPQLTAGALIGRVGNSAPFAIANQSRVTMPAGGDLQLGINDDVMGDNSGQFTVTISRPAGSAAVGTSGSEPAAPPITTGSAPAGAVAVLATNAWTPTGLLVRKGETIRFTSSGRVQLSSDPNDVAEPAGALSNRMAANAPMPSIPAGALIGRIGNSPVFGIGNLGSVQMPASGQLFLGVNDDHVADNAGQFNVTLSKS
jgi:hypothetical protein